METTTASAKKGKTLRFEGTDDAQKAAKAYIASVVEYTKLPKRRQLKIITGGMKKIEGATTPSTFLRCSEELFNNLYKSTEQFRQTGDKMVPSLQSLSTFFGRLQGKWELKIHPKASAYWFEFQYAFPPFTLEDKGLKVRFKNISMRINCDSGFSMVTRICRIGNRKTHLGKTTRIHPHGSSGSSGKFCLGDYRRMANGAREKWDFLSLFSIYDVAVHAYYRSGSYQPLDVFTTRVGWRCSGCGRWKDKEVKGEECCLCHRRFCSKCVKKSTKRENKRTKGCVECEKEAKEKVDIMCTSCLGERKERYSCRKCRNKICGKHRRLCHSCSNVFCSSCNPLKCPFCGGYPCEEHLSKVGKEDIAGICSYCSTYISIIRKAKEVEEAKKRLEKKQKTNVSSEGD